MDPDRLEMIYSTNDATEAEILRDALEHQGIRCQVVGGHQAGLTGIGIIEVKLFVRAADYEKAREFLEKQRGKGEL